MHLHDSFKLNTGASMPAIGLGTWQSPQGEQQSTDKRPRLVKHSPIVEYLAIIARNIEVVEYHARSQRCPRGIEQNAQGSRAFKKEVDKPPNKLTMDAVIDIDFVDTWKAMVDLLNTGKIVPAVNQVELHPYLPQDELIEFCQSKGIHVTAYSPLGSTGAPLQSEQIITSIAEKHKCTPAQVLINWAVERNTSVIPKSPIQAVLNPTLRKSSSMKMT
ncbi:NADP-dependent oxidoreductase domain-containing protein [Syncephalis plumigaleata]|nr:NADP-dependent oxidoreductase domain-containing protein [Syncephalis plumigaleata]